MRCQIGNPKSLTYTNLLVFIGKAIYHLLVVSQERTVGAFQEGALGGIRSAPHAEIKSQLFFASDALFTREIVLAPDL
jgi:hypothetical protein